MVYHLRIWLFNSFSAGPIYSHRHIYCGMGNLWMLGLLWPPYQYISYCILFIPTTDGKLRINQHIYQYDLLSNIKQVGTIFTPAAGVPSFHSILIHSMVPENCEMWWCDVNFVVTSDDKVVIMTILSFLWYITARYDWNSHSDCPLFRYIIWYASLLSDLILMTIMA